jgi:hypothetical protein
MNPTDPTVIAVVAGAVVVIGFSWWFFGSSSVAEETPKPKSKEEIAQMLESLGYKVKEVEFDDGRYEVEAYKNGKEFEIKVDRMGKILKIEEDD